jgi:hypothetical protein
MIQGDFPRRARCWRLAKPLRRRQCWLSRVEPAGGLPMVPAGSLSTLDCVCCRPPLAIPGLPCKLPGQRGNRG